VCVQYTDAGMYTCMQGERDHKIPGSYGHYKQDAQTYADWGVECKCFPSNIRFFNLACGVWLG